MKLLIPPPLQLIITGLIMFWISFQWGQWNLYFAYQKEISLLIIGAGLLIEVIAISAFFRAKTTVNPISPGKTSVLVVEGLYRFSRNPMYLGMAILLAGWALRLGNPLNAIIWCLFITGITHLQIKPEERILLEKFGEDYQGYCKRVRRWI